MVRSFEYLHRVRMQCYIVLYNYMYYAGIVFEQMTN